MNEPYELVNELVDRRPAVLGVLRESDENGALLVVVLRHAIDANRPPCIGDKEKGHELSLLEVEMELYQDTKLSERTADAGALLFVA